jgi:hypothetical protein
LIVSVITGTNAVRYVPGNIVPPDARTWTLGVAEGDSVAGGAVGVDGGVEGGDADCVAGPPGTPHPASKRTRIP